jgi:transposase
MIHLTADTRILLASEPADFRAGIDGLAAVCQQRLQHDPRCGALFVFINRRATMIRILAYDTNGFWIMTKRLSTGHFVGWPKSDQPLSTWQAVALRQLLNGVLQ